MLFARLFYFLRGYLVIAVTGPYPERFLNVCAARGIFIWDVFPRSASVLTCNISLRGFRLLPPVARKTGVTVKILEKCGLPILFARYKKRKWFIGGLVFCLLFIILLNQFIWKLEINGCETVSAVLVKEELAACGVHVGAFRPFLDEKKVQTQMLLKIPELSWLWVNKSGSKVIVQVKERVLPPAIYDPHAFCNLIAAKDGVIHAMIVKNGVPMVHVGDTVQKGDILVSGLIVSEKGVEPRQVQSEGEIYARVWYEKNKAFSLWSPKKNETGKKERKCTLHLFGWNLPLFIKDTPDFTEYISEAKEYEAVLFNRYLGFGITCLEFKEQTTVYEKLTAESVVQTGARQLLAAIDEMASPNAELKDSRTTHQMLDEETVEVTVVAEYLENIAQKAGSKNGAEQAE